MRTPIGRVPRASVLAPTARSGYESAPMHSRGTGLKWSLVGPTLLLLVAFNVFPLCYNIFLSFTNAELSTGAALRAVCQRR